MKCVLAFYLFLGKESPALTFFFSFPISVYINSLAELNLPYFTTEITTTSSSFALSLAKHMRSVGAKMYGAFWCSHCVEQKQVHLVL
jgi:hypothetical protein